jgi:hypothetical protein
VHTQVATTLTYSGADAEAAPKNNAAQPVTPPPAPPPQPVKKGGFFHSIGRFFKKVF